MLWGKKQEGWPGTELARRVGCFHSWMKLVRLCGRTEAQSDKTSAVVVKWWSRWWRWDRRDHSWPALAPPGWSPALYNRPISWTEFYSKFSLLVSKRAVLFLYWFLTFGNKVQALHCFFSDHLDVVKTSSSVETEQQCFWMLKGCVIQDAGAFSLIPDSISKCLCSYSPLLLGLPLIFCMCPDGWQFSESPSTDYVNVNHYFYLKE